jgi:hypothetical protein
VRRMPSFKKHRNHDAEYISMDDRYTSPYGEPQYGSHQSQPPVFRTQVSFSKLPVENPYYMKHISSEYWKGWKNNVSEQVGCRFLKLRSPVIISWAAFTSTDSTESGVFV